MRQLTHRAVDARAGLPLGSTSNLFRNRDALLSGALQRILERETHAWNALAAELRPLNGDTFAAAVGRIVRELTTRERVLTLARYAAFLEAGLRPELSALIADGQRQIATWAVPVITALGSADPPRDLGIVLSLVDGLIGGQLAVPHRDFDPADAIATLLRGIFMPGDVGYPKRK